MRIGIVSGEYPPMVGGVGAYTHILAKEFIRQGQHTSVLSNTQAQTQDTDIHLTNGVKSWGIGSLRTIRQWAKAEQLDLINLQFQTAAFGMSPWIHFLPDAVGSVPVVTTFHDLRYPYLFPKAGRLRDWIVLRLAWASDGVIVTNHEDQTRLQNVSKVTLIPIGSNILNDLPANFDPRSWREKAGSQVGDLLLAYFGLVNHSKGLETLFESMARLRAEGIPVRLVMIGGGAGSSDPTNAAYFQGMNRLIDELGLRPYVQQTGYLGDESVGAYLNAGDAVVLPFTDGASYRRGSLMAAIRYGCAIITTIPQVLIATFNNGENMLLVKPGDARDLENAIRRLYETPDLRTRLRQGAEELKREFEWPKIARATTDFFRWVLEESGS